LQEHLFFVSASIQTPAQVMEQVKNRKKIMDEQIEA
jgi:hypothetical protein